MMPLPRPCLTPLQQELQIRNQQNNITPVPSSNTWTVVKEKPIPLTTLRQNRTFCSTTNIVVKEYPLSLTTMFFRRDMEGT
jgi:hypothetical protein